MKPKQIYMNIPASIKQLVCVSLIYVGFIIQLQAQGNESHAWPKGYTVNQLFTHQQTLASKPTIYLSATKGEKHVLFQFSSERKFKKSHQLPAPALAAFGELVWVQVGKELQGFSIATGELIKQKKLPIGIKTVSALEIGFGETLFVADAENQKLYASVGNSWELLAEGTRLGKPSALLRVYGSLFIGTDQDFRVLDLEKRSLKIMTAGLKHVTAIVENQRGELLVLAQGDGQLVKIGRDRIQKVLPIQAKGMSDVIFDVESAKLLTLYPAQKKLLEIDYLTATGELREAWEATQKRPMQRLVQNGIVLNGAEYLIHTLEGNPQTQKMEIAQGYYPVKGVVYEGYANPATASAAALNCAAASYTALTAWMNKPSEAFQKTVDLGTPPLFWMMVDDYTAIGKSALLKPQRPAQLWYWERKEPVIGRVPGYWKWEAVLTKDGKCLIPQTAQIDAYLKEHAAKLKAN